MRDAKGNKDHLVPLPIATLTGLRRFWQLHRNPVLLFPHRHGGLKSVHLSTTPLDRGGVQAPLLVAITQEGASFRLAIRNLGGGQTLNEATEPHLTTNLQNRIRGASLWPFC